VGVDASDDETTFRAKVDGRLGLLALKDAPAVKRAIRAATR